MESPVKTLRASKLQFLSEEKFVEAQKVSDQLRDIQLKERKDTVSTLRSSQQTQLEALQVNLQQELAHFNSYWDSLTKETVDKLKEQQESLNEKHQALIASEKLRLEQETPHKWRPSPQYLDLMTKKDKAVKLGEFLTAEKFRRKALRLQLKEQEETAKVRTTSIHLKLSAFKNKQAKELGVLKGKQLQTLKELRKQRALEYNQLIKKFLNVKRNLAITQKLELHEANGKLPPRPAFRNISLASSLARPHRSIVNSPHETHARPKSMQQSRRPHELTDAKLQPLEV